MQQLPFTLRGRGSRLITEVDEMATAIQPELAQLAEDIIPVGFPGHNQALSITGTLAMEAATQNYEHYRHALQDQRNWKDYGFEGADEVWETQRFPLLIPEASTVASHLQADLDVNELLDQWLNYWFTDVKAAVSRIDAAHRMPATDDMTLIDTMKQVYHHAPFMCLADAQWRNAGTIATAVLKELGLAG